MGVISEILLTDNTQGVYKAGQEVKGLVKYNIDKPTEFTSAILSLRGKGSCWWLGGLNHIGATCIGTEDYVDQRMDLFEAKKTVTIAAGAYEKEFRFVLPGAIPPSYKDLRCCIEYYVDLEFLKTNGKRFYNRFDLTKVLGATKPYLGQSPTKYEATTEVPTSKESVTFNVEVEKTNINPGENVTVKIEIRNLSGHYIDMRSELIEYITYKSNCNHEKKVSETVNGSAVSMFAQEMKTELQDSQNIATTLDMFTIYSNILTREYKVKVGFKLLTPTKSVCIEIPMVIAEKIEESEEAKAVDLPPSYSQAMNEKEEEVRENAKSKIV